MNSFRIYLLVLSLAVMSMSCASDSKDKVEYQKTYHRNGKLFEATPYVNGKAHGIKLEYYEDGALRKEVPYDSGRVHGTVKFYYPDGKLFSETPQVNGKIDGVVKKYHKNGVTHSETPYLNGKVQPGLKEYNQRGELKDLPKLVFTLKKEKRSRDLLVTLEISLSNKQQSVKFFQGVYVDENSKSYAPIPTKDGAGMLTLILPPGSQIDKEILVKADFITAFRNRCILEENYRLVASN